jgi:hypothetical protein
VILLALCEATSLSERIFGVGIALAIVVFWVSMAWLFVWFEREPGERRDLFSILFIAGCTGAAVLLIPAGLSLETLLPAALIATVAVGGAGGHLLSVGIFRGVGAAIAGGTFLPLAVVVILIVSTFLGGTCLGEELS